MKYTHHKLEYEIADEWLLEVGAYDFKPCRVCYRTQSVGGIKGKVFIVSIDSVQPSTERLRKRGIFCDDQTTGKSAKQRVVQILCWFVADHEVEPVKVVKSNNLNHDYKLVEGCHRFHCANAMGFKCVPATMGFDINDPYASCGCC
jgi:hypothetical protein